MARVPAVVGLVGFVLASAGCPREPGDPPPVPGAECVGIADCNDGAVCGVVALCVARRCEAEPSTFVACSDGG